jgi:hypothetical protein
VPFGGQAGAVWFMGSTSATGATEFIKTDLMGRRLAGFSVPATADGDGVLSGPSLAALEPDGSVIVAFGSRVQRFSSNGVLLNELAEPSPSGSVQGATDQLPPQRPAGTVRGISDLAVAPNGDVLVTDGFGAQRFSRQGSLVSSLASASLRFGFGPDGGLYGTFNNQRSVEYRAAAATSSEFFDPVVSAADRFSTEDPTNWTKPMVTDDDIAWTGVLGSTIHRNGTFAFHRSTVVNHCRAIRAGSPATALPGGRLVTVTTVGTRQVTTVLRPARTGERSVCDEQPPVITHASATARSLAVTTAEPSRVTVSARVAGGTVRLRASRAWRTTRTIAIPSRVRRASARPLRLHVTAVDPNHNATNRVVSVR